METTEARIVSMERAETSKSKSPMWRCQTESGEQVNVFAHNDPYKDSYHFFAQAGFAPFMDSMAVGDKLIWRSFPIPVQMARNGQWWNITAVDAMLENAAPDTNATFAYDLRQYRREVSDWAKNILIPRSNLGVVVWDTETTGLNDDDEILTLGLINVASGEGYSVLIKPQQVDRVENQRAVHGISAEVARAGKYFPEVYWQVRPYLENAIWMLYNAPFDSAKLEAMCLRYELSPILPLAVVDVMEMFSRYMCEYDPKRGKLKTFTLEAAAELMGIVPEKLHNAAFDAETTLKLVEVMGDWIDL